MTPLNLLIYRHVATVLIKRGCLKRGSHIIAGVTQAKVRMMTDPTGATVKAAYPGMAVTVSGWKDLPKAGDEVLQGSEVDVKKALGNRLRKLEIEEELQDAEVINKQRLQHREDRVKEAAREGTANANVRAATTEAAEPEGPKELRLVVKADVSGSVEAVVGALEGMGNKEAVVKIVTTGVGDVTESDVMMAKAARGELLSVPPNTFSDGSCGRNGDRLLREHTSPR
jgi:translation initiation factor IF-2